MGTEKSPHYNVGLKQKPYALVKLNNPLMGTEKCQVMGYSTFCSIGRVKLNNPLMGTEKSFISRL